MINAMKVQAGISKAKAGKAKEESLGLMYVDVSMGKKQTQAMLDTGLLTTLSRRKRRSAWDYR